MDRTEYIGSRRGRYLAQTLEEFENTIEPLVPADVAQAFKAHVRRKFGAFSADCVELLGLEEKAMNANGHAQDLKDRLSPDGAASRVPGHIAQQATRR
jgi:hypothetical protein